MFVFFYLSNKFPLGILLPPHRTRLYQWRRLNDMAAQIDIDENTKKYETLSDPYGGRHSYFSSSDSINFYVKIIKTNK